MKKIIICLALMIAVSLQGCIVKSVHPFFHESDVTYNKVLEGNWTDSEGNGWTIHNNPFKPNSYEMHYSKKGREVALLGHLFKLDNGLYFDTVPIEDNTEELLIFDLHMVPTHSIAKVEMLTDKKVIIKWFNEEWLRKMFTENRIKIEHEMIMDENPTSKDDGMYLLTAATDELQKFVLKYGDNKEAYDDDLKLQLTK